jgi:hypothetical protein
LKRAPRGYPATHPRIDPASDDRADRRPPPSARALAAPAGMRSAGPAGARVSQATCGMARRVRRSLTPPAPLSAREMTRVASLRPRPALATSRSGQTGLESAPTRP